MIDVVRLTGFLETRLPEALELLRAMVGINSFTGNRAGVDRLGRFTAEAFGPLGMQAEFVASTHPGWGDHLVMTRPGHSARSLALVSHLDTVFPPEEEERNAFRWQRDGDRIYGPGTQDIKGGTVMMWLVLSALQALAPATFEAITWQLFWNSSEEQFSPDFGVLCRSRLGAGALAALVFEAEGRSEAVPRLVVARKGRAAWRISVEGRGAHAGSHHRQGANAIVQLAQLLPRVAALTDYGRDLTFNVGTVQGGTVLNRVPHEAVAEGEFRCFTEEVFAEARTALLALGGRGEVASVDDGYTCVSRVEVVSESRPWPRNPGSDRLFAVWERVAAELGRSVEAQARGGLSDGNLIWDAVPTLDGLGPWGEHDHCSERSADGTKVPEYVAASSFVPKAVWNVRAIERLAMGSNIDI